MSTTQNDASGKKIRRKPTAEEKKQRREQWKEIKKKNSVAGAFAYNPPQSFRFSVFIMDELNAEQSDVLGEAFPGQNAKEFSERKYKETSFRNVSGLEATLATEDAAIGGINDKTYKLPKKVNYGTLVLSRGISIRESVLTSWFWSQQQNNGKVIKKDLMVTLLSPKKFPLVIWLVYRAYPISWKVSDFDATANNISVEEVHLAYESFEIIKQ